MAYSFRKLKENTHFRRVDKKNILNTESHTLLVAKKQNRLEEEIYKNTIFKLEKETSSSLIKLCKNIYETSIELSQINYELKRNKLETIYKNYSFCASHRSNNKKKENENKNVVPNNDTNVENEEAKNSKDDRLNTFLIDLSTKSEKEVDFLLNNRPKSTPFTLFKKYENITSKKPKTSDGTNLTNNYNELNKSANLKVKSTSVTKKESKSAPTHIIQSIKPHSKQEIKKAKYENKEKNNDSESIKINLSNTESKVINCNPSLKDNLITIQTRPQTSVNERRKETINSKPRASSITKITFEETASLIIKEVNDAEDEMKDLYKETFSDISSTSSNDSRKSNKTEKSSHSKKSVETKNEKLVKDKIMFKINDLYEKSIWNLDHVSPKYGFKNNSLDDEDWLSDLRVLQAKRRELIIRNHNRYRVCSAWLNKIETNHNFGVAGRIRLNRLPCKINKTTRFDMEKEKQLFELTHKNLKDLMIKQMAVNEAKQNDRSVKEYMKRI